MSAQTTMSTGAWRWGQLFGVIVGVLTNVTTLLGFLFPDINSETVRQLIFPFTISVGCTVAIYALLALVAGVIGVKLAQRGLARTG